MLAALLGQTVWQPLRNGAARRALLCTAIAALVVWQSRPGSLYGTVVCFTLFALLSFVALALARVPGFGTEPPKPLRLRVGGLVAVGVLGLP